MNIFNSQLLPQLFKFSTYFMKSFNNHYNHFSIYIFDKKIVTTLWNELHALQHIMNMVMKVLQSWIYFSILWIYYTVTFGSLSPIGQPCPFKGKIFCKSFTKVFPKNKFSNFNFFWKVQDHWNCKKMWLFKESAHILCFHFPSILF